MDVSVSYYTSFVMTTIFYEFILVCIFVLPIYACVQLCTTAQTPGSLFAEEGGIDGVSFEACGRQAQGT